MTESKMSAALDTELSKKGLTKTDSDDADLYVANQTAIWHREASSTPIRQGGDTDRVEGEVGTAAWGDLDHLCRTTRAGDV